MREPLPHALLRAVLVLLVATLARPVLALGEWLAQLAAHLQARPRLCDTVSLALVGVGIAAAVVGFAVSRQAATPHVAVAPPAVRTSRPPRAPTARWLTSAGRYKVERIRAPQAGVRVDLRRPPAGVGHTTECGLNCALRVFRRHYAPHFLVGRDDRNRIRIFQFVPLGDAASTLRNLDGGVETNTWARAQIELTARSHERSWTADPGVMAAFEALLAELRDVAGIPLTRPFRYEDGYSERASRIRRASGTWGHAAGWFNHAEVPENDHWDMGGFRWSAALAGAHRQAALVHAGAAARSPASG